MIKKKIPFQDHFIPIKVLEIFNSTPAGRNEKTGFLFTNI